MTSQMESAQAKPSRSQLLIIFSSGREEENFSRLSIKTTRQKCFVLVVIVALLSIKRSKRVLTFLATTTTTSIPEKKKKKIVNCVFLLTEANEREEREGRTYIIG